MTDPFSGIEALAYFKNEATYDVATVVAAGDAVSYVELSIEPTQDAHKLEEHVGTQSLQGWVRGNRGGSWSAKFYLKPKGVGTPPDIDEMIEAAMGKLGVDAGTVAYGLSAASAQPLSLQGTRVIGTDFVEQANGCWVEQIEFEVPEDGTIPSLTFSGGFATYGWCRTGLLTVKGATAHAALDTTIFLFAGQIGAISENANVAFGAEDNGGAGYLVTDVDYDLATAVITPGLVGPLVGGELISIVYPTPAAAQATIGGTVLGSTECELEVGSAVFGVMSAKITLATGVVGLNRECSTDRPNRTSKNERLVSGEIKMFALTENASFVGLAYELRTNDVDFRVGANVAGKRWRMHVPSLRAEVTPYDIPESEAAMVAIAWEGSQATVPDDEFDILLD